MKKTVGSFAEADVLRWETAHRSDLPATYARILRGDVQRGRLIRRFARMHESAGLTQIARSAHALGLGHLAASAAAWAHLLERFAAGDDIETDFLQEGGNGFVLAEASGHEPAVNRMLSAFSAARPKILRPSGDISLSDVFAALCRRDLESASQALLPAIATTERSDTVAMLQAILDHDEAAFRKSVAQSAERWRKAIRAERLQKFPDAVCDHWAIGDIRLAQRVWGRRPNVDLTTGQIPPEIFDAVAAPVDGIL